MRRGQYHPEWSEPHLLSFVTDATGKNVVIHADLAGITMLIDELESIREQLVEGDCPHTHLFSPTCGRNELTMTKLEEQQNEVNTVHHVKIYGWNSEWAVNHRLLPPPASSTT